MKPRHLIFILAPALLAGLFFFPLWKITLIAPQYPDGVVLKIWIDKVGGDSPSTLQNINILNHYIGMKYIEPESIPELKYFKYIVGAMVALGLIAFFTRNKWMYLGWTLLMVLLAIAGLYDFYLWLYDYGHNLSPNAPIKVPGMVYQPPLIGNKYLLNFLAKSWPATGGLMAAGSIIIGFLSFWLVHRTRSK